MPLSWMPTKRTIEQDIAEELARIEELRLKAGRLPETPEPETPVWETPVMEQPQPIVEEFQPTTTGREWMPQVAPLEPLPAPALQPEVEEEPWYATVAEQIGKPFEWIKEHLEEPWAEAITTPFRPTGVSYEEWEAPKGAKGFAEFTMPLWWIPWFGWSAKGAKALMGTSRLAKVISTEATKNLLPTYAQLNERMSTGLVKKMALWSKDKPVLNKIIEAVGGPAAFAKKVPETAEEKALSVYRNYAIQRNMGRQLVDTQMPDLYIKTIKDGKRLSETELFKITDAEVFKGQIVNGKVGVVITDAMHPGILREGKVSYYFHDVWQNYSAYKWTDPVARAYVEEGHKIERWFLDWAAANDVIIPTSKKGLQMATEVIQEHIVRIAKGVVREGEEALFKKTNPYKEMLYETMAEGVEAGVKYGGSYADAIELMTRAIANRVTRSIFTKEVNKLGKTIAERFTEKFPTIAASFSRYEHRVDILSKGLLALQKSKAVHPDTLEKIVQQFPTLADEITRTSIVTPTSMVRYLKGLSKSSQLIIKDGKTPLIEALLALPKKTSFYDTIRTVSKYTTSEEKAIRFVERFYTQQAKAEIKNYKKLIETVKTQLTDEEALFKTVKAERATILRRLREPKLERGEARFLGIPGFQNRIFPIEVVNFLQPKLAERVGAWINNLAKVSGTSRMAVAALDLSAPFIQGLMVFGTNPILWAKSTFKMLKIAGRPFQLYTELATRKATRMERVLHGGSTSVIDYFEAMPFLRKLGGKVAKGKGEAVVAETYGRAEAAFLGFGEIARDELWKAGTMGIKAKGLSEVTENAQLDELAKSLDKMTGVMSSEALGIGITQRQVESAWIFFAPRYTRAGLAFMGDVIRGGLTGAEARKALTGTLLGGLTLYYGMTKALGQEPSFDPRSAKFMTIKVGDRHVGIGGIYYSTLRLMADIATTGTEEPTMLLPSNLSRTDNPFYKWLYARTSPLTATTFGLAIEHKNYLGEPFENAGDYAAFLVDKILPISLQSMMPWERKDWQEKAGLVPTFGLELAGLRTFPLSTWEVRDMARDNLSQQVYNMPWKELSRAQQREIEDVTPMLVKLGEEISKQQLQRGKPLDILFNRWQDELEDNKNLRDERINNVAQGFEIDKDGYQFQQRIRDIENDYAAVMSSINANKTYAPVFEELEKPKVTEEEELSEGQKLDATYEVWTQYRYSKTETPWGRMQNDYGEPEWNNIEKFREWFRKTYGEDALRYAETDKPLAGRNLPPVYLELLKARQLLKPYWQVPANLIKLFGKPKTDWGRRRIATLTNKMRKQMRRQWALSNPEALRLWELFYTEV